MGAPRGNTNAMTTGVDVVASGKPRHGLTSPRVSNREKHVNNKCDDFRREVEGEFRRVKGRDPDLTESSIVSRAVDHERARVYLACRLRRLEDAGNEQSVESLIRIFDEMRLCGERRHAAIIELDLDGKAAPANPYAILASATRTPAVAPFGPSETRTTSAPVQRDTGDPRASDEVVTETDQSAPPAGAVGIHQPESE